MLKTFIIFFKLEPFRNKQKGSKTNKHLVKHQYSTILRYETMQAIAVK